jgi:hypothetical protein
MESSGDLIWDARSAVVSTPCGQGAELDEVMGEDATVGRMETQGLVRREQSTRDARAYNAVLTDAGLKRYEEATPTHDISLRRYLFNHLECIDLDALQHIIAAADNRTTVPSSST